MLPATPSSLRALARLLAALFAAALPLFAAENATPPHDEITELPRFVVTDSRILPPPESWRYATLPGFEILSNASNSSTSRFLEDFQLLQTVIDVIWPAASQYTRATPACLVICGRGDHYTQFLPTADRADSFSTASVFLQDKDRFAIAMDMRGAEIFDSVNDEMISIDPYRAFYEAYFRFLIQRASGNQAPLWFEEGLVAILSDIDFTEKWIELGNLDTSRSNQLLRHAGNSALMPWDEFFNFQRGEDPQLTSRWKRQAFVFTHLCLFGRNLQYRKPLLDLVLRSAREPVSEAMFRECFKINYKAMALELRGYTQFADHKYAQYKPKKGQKLPAPEKIVLREATDAESGRIKGELLRLGGHTTEARNALIAPYIRGEREPRLLAALGVNELASNDKVRARKFLEAAFKAGSTDSRGNIELARLRLDEALAAKPALDAAQTQQILAPLEVARVQRPPFAEAFDLIARVWMSSTLRPSAEQAKILLQGAASFPRNGALVYHAALAFSQHGYPKEARALVEHGVKAGYSENATSAFRELQSTLPSLPPTP